jgi:hypothetical protein
MANPAKLLDPARPAGNPKQRERSHNQHADCAEQGVVAPQMFLRAAE